MSVSLGYAFLCLFLVNPGEVDSAPREEAFIGYSEDSKTSCKDQHATCMQWTKQGECGLTPYFMRKECAKVYIYC